MITSILAQLSISIGPSAAEWFVIWQTNTNTDLLLIFISFHTNNDLHTCTCVGLSCVWMIRSGLCSHVLLVTHSSVSLRQTCLTYESSLYYCAETTFVIGCSPCGKPEWVGSFKSRCLPPVVSRSKATLSSSSSRRRNERRCRRRAEHILKFVAAAVWTQRTHGLRTWIRLVSYDGRRSASTQLCDDWKQQAAII